MLIQKIVTSILVLCFAGCPTPVISQTTDATTTPPRTLSFEETVEKYALQYNVSADRMLATIRCENRELDPALQSRQRYPYDVKKWGVKAGEREQSFGLAQIHLPDHPNVSLSQATDADFSIAFMAREFAAGRAHSWTCYKNLYGVE